MLNVGSTASELSFKTTPALTYEQVWIWCNYSFNPQQARRAWENGFLASGGRENLGLTTVEIIFMDTLSAFGNLKGTTWIRNYMEDLQTGVQRNHTSLPWPSVELQPLLLWGWSSVILHLKGSLHRAKGRVERAEAFREKTSNMCVYDSMSVHTCQVNAIFIWINCSFLN